MNFYTSIHQWYDQVFPYSPVQREFVRSFGDNPELSVADVGCGTGNLALALARDFRVVTAIDPDESMLGAARRKSADQGVSLNIIRGGMLDLTSNFNPESIDRLICFGNTLPHLSTEKEVGEFARQAFQVLRPGCLFLVQIINYDRILDQKLTGLPTIENDSIRFERIYSYRDNPTHVAFKTRLTIKSTGEIIDNEVDLLAIRPATLKNIMIDAGFRDIREFGSFSREPFSGASQPFLLASDKPVRLMKT